MFITVIRNTSIRHLEVEFIMHLFIHSLIAFIFIIHSVSKNAPTLVTFLKGAWIKYVNTRIPFFKVC